jgi:hypothetical protein
VTTSAQGAGRATSRGQPLSVFRLGRRLDVRIVGYSDPMRVRASAFAVLYLAAGLIVAGLRNYYDDIDTARDVVSAALAVLLWPLVLLGVDLHLRR